MRKKIKATHEEIISETGLATHIPVMPQIEGKMASRGNKTMTCLKSVRNNDILAFPML